MKKFPVTYDDVTSVENLLSAWQEFVKGKRGKRDVQEFQLCLMDNVLSLHRDLVSGAYRHGPYHAFNISDPKPRSIHKATVRDRLLHHAIYRKLYPPYDRTFIADSFSSRNGKGTHRALERFRSMCFDVSNNHTKTIWVLKCDVKKFFASVDHNVLLALLRRRITDARILTLLENVIGSFYTGAGGVGNITHMRDVTSSRSGLPLGNLTSQLLANVYLNELDQHVKRTLKVRHYIRYADDFVVLHHDKLALLGLLRYIVVFLREQLRLELHTNKVSIKTLASGVDFLGWVHFPDHCVLRTATKRRMLKHVRKHQMDEMVQSYLGLLRYGSARKLERLVVQ